MIVPLTTWWAEIVCRSWGCDTRLYAAPAPARNLACIGVVRPGTHDVSAVALLERVGTRVVVWDVACNDYESGTRLVRAMSRHPPDVLVFGHTVHPRWTVARAYFRSVPPAVVPTRKDTPGGDA